MKSIMIIKFNIGFQLLLQKNNMIMLGHHSIEMMNPCLKPISTEIFRIFPAPFDFSRSSRNIELFSVILGAEREISKVARSGNTSVLEDFLGWCFQIHILLCLQTFEAVLAKSAFDFLYIFLRHDHSHANNRGFLARKQPAGLSIIID